MCTAKGLDARPGVPWVSASFAWQAWDKVHMFGSQLTRSRQIQADPVSRFSRGEAEGLEITSLLCAGPPAGPVALANIGEHSP